MATSRKRHRDAIDSEIFERQARICKAFANATRLHMLDLLGKREWPASDLQQALGISKANLSQHLAVLKTAGIVGTKRDGRKVYVSLVMPEMKEACRMLHNVLRAQIQNDRRLVL